MTTSYAPAITPWAAKCAACWLDPHCRSIVVAGTAFLVSWIGLRSTPDNPQARLMTYLIPGIMLIFFVNFASGLNLYYAVQNIASLPQQWLIAKERQKMAKTPRVQSPPPTVAAKEKPSREPGKGSRRDSKRPG